MWLGSDGVVLRVPVATVSALLLGPGSTVTHAAIKACAESNTPVCWVGADSLHFYATGTTPTHDNSNARLHAELYAAPHKRNAIARAMFARRFPDLDVASKSIQQLRGYEGERVRTLYADFGSRYAVSWKGRNYDPSNWSLADNINRAISTANAALYALCSSVVCSMGFLPQLGFIHSPERSPSSSTSPTSTNRRQLSLPPSPPFPSTPPPRRTPSSPSSKIKSRRRSSS
jgi:CRISPR-associated protein Cas1